ncbi:general odorant-binding protein 56h-like [Condylostylus longicornis]|uniref:general odorant-binding protein 56h-like n=1 Tax=Condylostylus longicornis TaxID=2530218 RepID=UPI00244DD0B4|nr:general odorant-binding protein 56h-like [Condylostylus longicornis]
MEILKIVLIFTFFIQLSLSSQKNAFELADMCIKELNITNDTIKLLSSTNVRDPTMEYKCFHKCFFEKADFVKNSAIQEANIIKMLTEEFTFTKENVEKALRACRDVDIISNDCDSIFDYLLCMKENLPKRGIQAIESTV